ncbi:hypothetical protein STRATTON_126 [Erwinia phage vB_EamM_Stratton]|uniref:Uncharacterized protein n=2 Tax=Erskinevirus EaH2 TaxID=2169883 RepID=A0A1B2IGZ9_9CAUD|nr:hypothetical protein G173_gp031 [Erwinia phage phiEaH2]AFQ96576.1 hypothetical protein [Erwinia phage phiEaH2]ANZ50551.1 hypothetical protein STRATTON_126 [Erwinia phage vB_EamM_Stratton]
MQINRSIAKTKEVVYTVVDGNDEQFAAVIDEDHVLQVAYPGEEVTRGHQRVLDKLIAKVKGRDGVKTYNVLTGYTLQQGESEILIVANGVSELV